MDLCLQEIALLPRLAEHFIRPQENPLHDAPGDEQRDARKGDRQQRPLA
jgi:hypothetical protein